MSVFGFNACVCMLFLAEWWHVWENRGKYQNKNKEFHNLCIPKNNARVPSDGDRPPLLVC